MTIKRDCVVIVPCIDPVKFSPEEEISGKGKAYTPHEHPDFLRALRAISDYHYWVEARLMPIACKWMEEHKDEFKSSLSEDEQSDIGASIEAAYQVVAKSEWWTNIQRNQNDPSFLSDLLEKMTPNPLWQRESAAFFEAENAIKRRR